MTPGRQLIGADQTRPTPTDCRDGPGHRNQLHRNRGLGSAQGENRPPTPKVRGRMPQTSWNGTEGHLLWKPRPDLENLCKYQPKLSSTRVPCRAMVAR